MATQTAARDPSTVVEGLDDALDGGPLLNRGDTLRGDPGVGETTYGMQFLTAGHRPDGTALRVDPEGTTEAIRRNAESQRTPERFDIDSADPDSPADTRNTEAD